MKKNLNNRVYSKECVLKIAEQAKEMILKGNLLGEIGPSSSEVSLSQVSHRVTEVHFNEEKNSLDGSIKILETPKGKDILKLIESFGGIENFNTSYCIRSRGTGNINEKGEVENYDLHSFDIIPRSEDAFKNIDENNSDIENIKPISEKDILKGI